MEEIKLYQIRAHFMENVQERIALMNFLECSYNGGIKYKEATDAHGNPVLIEHENEVPFGSHSQSLFQRAQQAGNSESQKKMDRYFRRKRIASYENHVKPIVDKIASYVLRNEPIRHEKAKQEMDRLELAKWIESMVLEGLKIGEAWIGWDAAPINPDAQVTRAEARLIDPKNEGNSYIIMVDARRVVDFEIDDNDEVIRVVFEESIERKSTLTEKRSQQVIYKEWNDQEWVIYEQTKETQQANDEIGGIPVKEIARSNHSFGRCPWVRFVPPFPIEDIAELNRALFNMSSLLDEELYNSTFTQKWITGEKVENVNGAEGGTGNTIVIQSPDAKCGTFGAVPGQSNALMDRVNHLRDAIYMIVSMESSSTKNVAETAEKKKRDLESLYTMLVQIARTAEYAENLLLIGMEIIEEDNQDQWTKFDNKFDVNSVSELQAEIELLNRIPFSPASLKRKLAEQLSSKLDPFGDQAAYVEEIGKIVDSTEGFLKGVEILVDKKLATPEILADLLGIPDNQRAAFIESLAQHAEQEKMQADAAAAKFGQVEDEEDEEDEPDRLPDFARGSADDKPGSDPSAIANPAQGNQRGFRG